MPFWGHTIDSAGPVSYVVLARKYRPLRFDDMVGQEHVGRTLGNAIRQDRVHHAYLFAGARGLGKTTTARIFAKGLVCEEGPTPTPCNACKECVAVNEGHSVDVVEIDGASNNSVDNIRNLREQVHYLPQTARRKVYIIDEVHMLTTSAFNALLKTLEEPPAHVNFIFATTEPHKVLPTILSRVSRLDFRRVSIPETVGHLKSILEREELAVDEGGLQLIAKASGGSVRDALTLLDQVIAFSENPKAVGEAETRRVLGQAQRQSIAELVDAILERDADLVVTRFDELVTAGHDLMVLSLQLLEHFRDLTVVKVCKGREVLRGATDSEYELLREQAGKADAAVLGQLFDRFTRIVDRLPDSRVPRLLLEMGLLDLTHAEPLMPLGDLLDQLNDLAGGGGTAGGGGGQRPTPTGGRTPTSQTGGKTRRAAPSPSENSTPSPSAAPTSPPATAGSASPPATSGPVGFAPATAGSASPPATSGPVGFAPATAGSASPPATSGPAGFVATTAGPAASPHAPAGPAASPPTTSASATRSALSTEPSAPATGTPASPIGAEDSPFTRELWAKVQGDLGPSSAATPSNGSSAATAAPPSTAAPPATAAPPSTAAPPARATAPTTSPATAPTTSPATAPTTSPATAPTTSPATTPTTSPAAAPTSSLATAPTISPAAPPATAPTTAAMTPPTAAPTGPIVRDGRSAFDIWEELVARIRIVDEYASAVLSALALVELSEGTVRVAAPSRSFEYKELASRPDVRSQLEQACRDHLGAPHEVQLVEGEADLPDRPSIVLVNAQRAAAHQAAIEAEARDHASIRSLLSTFNAKIQSTKSLAPPRRFSTTE